MTILKKFHKFWPADVHLVGKEVSASQHHLADHADERLGIEIPKRFTGMAGSLLMAKKMSKSGQCHRSIPLFRNLVRMRSLLSLLNDIQLGQDGNWP